MNPESERNRPGLPPPGAPPRRPRPPPGIVRWRRATVGARLRPSFLVIGAQKSATTALFDLLAMHPLVLAPVSASVQVHYFDDFHDFGPAWYRSHFPLMRPVFRITGEASPSYMFHRLAPRRAAAFDPGMKLVAILRDPVERALSHHAMATRRGHETLPFEAAVDAEPGRLSGLGPAVADSPRYRRHSHRVHAYLGRGLYAEQLQRWLEHFPRRRLLVLRTEDFWADRNRFANRVYGFLGLPRFRVPVREFTGQRSYAIDAALRRRLEEYFADDQARLQALFDDL